MAIIVFSCAVLLLFYTIIPSRRASVITSPHTLISIVKPVIVPFPSLDSVNINVGDDSSVQVYGNFNEATIKGALELQRHAKSLRDRQTEAEESLVEQLEATRERWRVEKAQEANTTRKVANLRHELVRRGIMTNSEFETDYDLQQLFRVACTNDPVTQQDMDMILGRLGDKRDEERKRVARQPRRDRKERHGNKIEDVRKMNKKRWDDEHHPLIEDVGADDEKPIEP